jgi:hypothetical protein
MIQHLLRRGIASDALAARVGQIFASGAACLIPVLVVRRFAAIDFTEAELLIAVLATMSMALLCAVIAELLAAKAKAA